jgi:hypothetical protein
MCVTAADAQTYSQPKARRQWVTISYDWLYTKPLHFAEHPLEELLGTRVDTPVDNTLGPYDFRTRDGTTLIAVEEFTRHGHGISATVYPLGLSSGPTLAVRGSIENLPDISVRFDGPGSLDRYRFSSALAYDAGVGIYVADRSPGWGLGSYAFVVGGVGRIKSDQGNGGRYFAEGGGGLQSGPFGFEVALKFGWNHMTEPVDHRFLTIPLTMRATVSF